MARDGDDARPAIVLFRNDLRLADNLALSAAVDSGAPVLPVLILDDGEGRPIGAARRWWLHHSIERLSESLTALGARLVLRRGAQNRIVREIVDNTKAAAVFWNRRYDPPAAEADRELKQFLRSQDVRAESFDGQLLHEPSRLLTGSGGHYKVFSPFWRALVSGPEPREPVAAPRALRGYAEDVTGDALSDWNLLPKRPDWAGGLRQEWTPGEAGGKLRLDAFLDAAIDGYGEARDRPDGVTTSRLSPHLAHGEITPFQIWHAASRAADAPAADIEKFRKELAWREFSYHLLFHNPKLAEENFNSDFADFPWRPDSRRLKAWKRGETGYPIVDAGMRELWRTGWMHNRVRMVCASFLTKHLLQDWREGERWFWDTLVDADPANNPASWQWVAGSGADAAPYFRVFNPVLQGEKFDADGGYLRRFVPEISGLPGKFVHRPWEARPDDLAGAGVKLGSDYPVPLVDHQKARDVALAAYQEMKGTP